ncbi:hypothetical protein J6590_085058 [Homalodisca vitripennis]|nr:hypothetical protein J6590_085058 [Homalodisca vitripennis]
MDRQTNSNEILPAPHAIGFPNTQPITYVLQTFVFYTTPIVTVQFAVRVRHCPVSARFVKNSATCPILIYVQTHVQRLSPDNLIKQRRPWLLLGQVTAERSCPSSLSARPLVVVQKSPLSRWSPG